MKKNDELESLRKRLDLINKQLLSIERFGTNATDICYYGKLLSEKASVEKRIAYLVSIQND